MRSNTRKIIWENRIKECLASGLNCHQWAIQNDLSYRAVLYWKNKLEEKQVENTPAFIELEDSNQPSGISLMIEDVKIVLEAKFDPSTLKSCIQVLRAITCSR